VEAATAAAHRHADAVDRHHAGKAVVRHHAVGAAAPGK
jgi:hypothetical protein